MNDSRLDELWARQQIQELAFLYAYAVDTHDWTLMESLWVDTPNHAQPPSLDVHTARRLPQALAEQQTSTLFVGNHLIYLDSPDRAHGTVYCMAYVDRGARFIEQAIIYRDSYERHGGKWLFLKRDHLLWWGQERPENPMCQAPANWPRSQVGSGIAYEMIRRK